VLLHAALTLDEDPFFIEAGQQLAPVEVDGAGEDRDAVAGVLGTVGIHEHGLPLDEVRRKGARAQTDAAPVAAKKPLRRPDIRLQLLA
jgi:hypothetical protein